MALWNMYINGQKLVFSGISPKILTFEWYTKNKTCSEVNFIWVYQIWSKLIENWWNNLQITTSGLQYLVVFKSISPVIKIYCIIELIIFLECLSFKISYCTLYDLGFSLFPRPSKYPRAARSNVTDLKPVSWPQSDPGLHSMF